MKNATEWLNQVGEVVMFSAFAGSNPPGNEVENLVRQIQADAWRQGMTDAAEIVHGVDDPALELAIVHRRDAAQPNDPSSATRPTKRVDCNLDAMAGFAAAHG